MRRRWLKSWNPLFLQGGDGKKSHFLVSKRPNWHGLRHREKANSYAQPSVFDMLAGASPASAMDGWAE